MESILVTGGAGFIGSHFVRAFMRRHRKSHVHVLDALTYAGDLDNLPPNILDNPRFHFWYGNVCDGDFNQDLFVGGPDFDVFLQCFGWFVGAQGPPDDPDCAESDMSGDGFVGGPDFGLFIKVFNGPPGP